MPALADEDDAEDGYCDKRRHRNGEADRRTVVPSPRLGVATEHPDQKLMVFARAATPWLKPYAVLHLHSAYGPTRQRGRSRRHIPQPLRRRASKQCVQTKSAAQGPRAPIAGWDRSTLSEGMRPCRGRGHVQRCPKTRSCSFSRIAVRYVQRADRVPVLRVDNRPGTAAGPPPG